MGNYRELLPKMGSKLCSYYEFNKFSIYALQVSLPTPFL